MLSRFYTVGCAGGSGSTSDKNTPLDSTVDKNNNPKDMTFTWGSKINTFGISVWGTRND